MSRKSTGWVYFIQAESIGLIKIGWTASRPLIRLSMLAVGSPVNLTLLGVSPGNPDLERQTHGRFRADRERGEWFRPSEALKQFIAENAVDWTPFPPAPRRGVYLRDDDTCFRYSRVTVARARTYEQRHCDLCRSRAPEKQEVYVYRSPSGEERIVCRACARIEGKIASEVKFWPSVL